ncbi:hypothetical protein CUMW_017500 [Citrus unshiu]|nr:hypothetical protein CUMW_017500 [Citrus unshiu]
MVVTYRRRRRHADWSALPEGILQVISEKLAVADSLSFSKVCKSWRDFSLESLHYKPSSQGLPWLCMSGQASTKIRTCSIIFENKIRFLDIIKAFGGCLWGSFDDWLIIVRPVYGQFWTIRQNIPLREIRISLLNPFSGADYLLPAVKNCYHKLALSGNPHEESCVYILLDLESAKFALWTRQIQNWCECEIEGEDDDNPFLDVISVNSCFYLLTKAYDIHVVDIKTACSIVKKKSRSSSTASASVKAQTYKVRINENAQEESVLVLRYLVKLNGEILLVCRFLNRKRDIKDFEIYKLDLCRSKWVLLHSLGDDQDLGVGRGNCLYFTNEYELPWSNEWDIKEFQHHKGSEIEDWGIFRLGNENPENFHGYAERGNWPPIWLTAPIILNMSRLHGPISFNSIAEEAHESATPPPL